MQSLGAGPMACLGNRASPKEVRGLARAYGERGDFQLMYWLLKGGGFIGDYLLQWNFSNPAPGQAQDSTLAQSSISCDLYVYSLRFDLFRPNAFPGNVFGPTENKDKAWASGLSCQLQIQDCRATLLTDGQEPIGLIAAPIGASDDASLRFIIPWGGSMKGRMTWNTTPTSNDIPSQVSFRMRGLALGCVLFRYQFPQEKARERLEREFKWSFEEMEEGGYRVKRLKAKVPRG